MNRYLNARHLIMKKKIVGLLVAAMLIPASYANARGGHHGNDFGRVVGYTAAAVVTAGVVGAICCSNRDRGYSYDRGYRQAQYEQYRYDQEMRSRYYAPPPVVYYEQPRPVYYAPQPVYYQPVYAQPRPVYYGY